MWVVTIDGPAGAGKSTVARRLADALGWRMLDTGAMYRAVALAALRARADLDDDRSLGRIADSLSVKLPPGKVLLNGEDVTLAIRSVEVTRATSAVADKPSVRHRLVALQRALAADADLVTEGRDQGTIVFPDALRKFFLTASLDERARRRHAEHLARGEAISLESIGESVRQRDDRDAARAIAPLQPAPDAEVIDTTGVSLDDVLQRLSAAVHAALGEAK